MGIARLGAYHIGVGVFVRCFGAQAALLLFFVLRRAGVGVAVGE